MKNKVAMIGILILCFTCPVFAQASSGDAVLVLKDIQIPSEVYPGDSFDISFKVENSWYADTKEIYVYLEGGYPLLNISPTEPHYIKRLGFEYIGKTSDPFSFALSVDRSATAGSYTVNVVLTYRRYAPALGVSGGYERYREIIPVLIKVKGRPGIEVFVKSSQPGEIGPGEEAEIRLETVNIGTEEARNVLILLNPIDEIDVLWFSRTVYVGDILPQKSKTAVISIDVEEGIEAIEYALPIKVAYETPDGEKIATSGEINITIKESVDFAIAPVVNSANAGDREKTVAFKVQNSGNNLAEEVKTVLRASYPFTPTGNEFFIGKLQPGEGADVSFHVDVDTDAASQRYPVDIIIQWKEDDQQYSETKSSFIEVFTVESNWQIYAGIVVGVIAFLIVLTMIRRR
ncbi:MAG: hypothetical protein V3V36_02165 [Candidatus Hydrothermarchaeaceae archaeon]